MAAFTSTKTLSRTGPYHILASGLFYVDGVDVTEDGTAYFTTMIQNTEIEIRPGVEIPILTGNLDTLDVAGATDVVLVIN
jgi:hypothetical protein